MKTPCPLALLSTIAIFGMAWGQPPSGEKKTFTAWDSKEGIAAYAKRVGLPPTYSLDLGKGVRLELVLIPAGSFLMGAAADEEKKIPALGDASWERPQHKVAFARPFYMGKYEVTQAQWLALIGKAPEFRSPLGAEKSPEKYGSYPIENVTMKESQAFCTRASAYCKRIIRLPSEAEWEYACRAGTTTVFYFGDKYQRHVKDNEYEILLSKYYFTDAKGPYAVGQKLPNAWGLYDMYGNVFERTADPHHRDYRGAPSDGSVWTEGGDASKTWLRGGSWKSGDTLDCRSASRTWATSVNMRSSEIGFRVVMELN